MKFVFLFLSAIICGCNASDDSWSVDTSRLRLFSRELRIESTPAILRLRQLGERRMTVVNFGLIKESRLMISNECVKISAEHCEVEIFDIGKKENIALSNVVNVGLSFVDDGKSIDLYIHATSSCGADNKFNSVSDVCRGLVPVDGEIKMHIEELEKTKVVLAPNWY